MIRNLSSAWTVHWMNAGAEQNAALSFSTALALAVLINVCLVFY